MGVNWKEKKATSWTIRMLENLKTPIKSTFHRCYEALLQQFWLQKPERLIVCGFVNQDWFHNTLSGV